LSETSKVNSEDYSLQGRLLILYRPDLGEKEY
jgi:hypothetical protein